MHGLCDPDCRALAFTAPGLLHWPKANYDAFMSANFAELQPAKAAARLLSAFMALIGVFLTGLLGFVAGNRIRRS